MKYIVDIDGTICKKNETGDYTFAEPFRDRIAFFNKLHEDGHEIVYYTGRGSTTGRDWSRETYEQLHEWGATYTTVMFGKVPYDLWIDDKAVNSDAFFEEAFSK